ncbi:MAG: HEAT repeat domain-containing protein, partial [Alphaproteobacteria bacterium]
LQQKKNGGINEKTQTTLVYLIYTTGFLFAAIFAFVDYTLCLQALKEMGKNTSQIMRFFGLTWGLIGGFALFALSMLYSLRRSFHIIIPLMILSFLPLTCSLGYFSDTLWIVLFSKICVDLILYFCMGYYFRMLSRPLSRSEQTKLKASTFLIAVPAGFAFTSLTFYFTVFDKSALFLACMLSVLFLLALIDDQNEYAKVLLSNFKNFRWRGGRLIITSPTVLQYIVQKTESQNAAEAIYFLRVLEESQVPNLKRHLRHALNHLHPKVRCFALESIERNDLHMFKKTLSDVMDKDLDVEVRQKALEVFCALGEKYGTEKAILYLDDNDLKKGALIGLLKNGGEGVLIASDGLNKLVHSKNYLQRLQAAQILTQAPKKGFFRSVLALMQDSNLVVQKQAFHAAGLNKHPALLDLLFKGLEQINLRDEALAALDNFGSVAYAQIKDALSGTTYGEACKKNLIRFLWIKDDVEAKHILLACLKKMPVDLRIYAMTFLSKKTIYLSKKQRRKIFVPLIEMDFKQALTMLLLIQDLRETSLLEDKTYFDLLIDSLYNDFLKIRYCLLSELVFLFPSSFMQQATQILKNTASTEEEKKLAQSTLDDILPKKEKTLRFITDDANLARRIEKLPPRLQNKTNFDKQFSFILRGKSYRSLWTKLCALTCIRRINDVSVVKDVADLLSDKNALIRQAALWTLDRLVVDKKQRKRLFLPLSHDSNSDVANQAAQLLK